MLWFFWDPQLSRAAKSAIEDSQRRKLVSDVTRSVFSLYCDWAKLGTEFLGEWLASQALNPSGRGRHPSEITKDGSHTNGGASDDYNTFPNPAEVRAFLKSGHTLITLRELRQRLRTIA